MAYGVRVDFNGVNQAMAATAPNYTPLYFPFVEFSDYPEPSPWVTKYKDDGVTIIDQFFVAPSDGWYVILGQIFFVWSGTQGEVVIREFLNGGQEPFEPAEFDEYASPYPTTHLANTVRMMAGDVLRWEIYLTEPGYIDGHPSHSRLAVLALA